MKKVVLSILVENSAGVLSRVSMMFSRRGYNISSLTVGETENPKFSRMTVVVEGDDKILTQIRKQLDKLVEVVEVKELLPGTSVCRELVLVKVSAGDDVRQTIISITDIFRAKIVDVATDSLMIEMTGGKEKIDAFLRMIENYGILEMVRTGLSGLARGTENQE